MDGKTVNMVPAYAFFLEYGEWPDQLAREESLFALYSSSLGSFAPMRAEIAGFLPCWRQLPPSGSAPTGTAPGS